MAVRLLHGQAHSLLWQIPNYLFSPSCKPKDSKVREKSRREGTMGGGDPTAGGENQQHTRTVHHQISYRASEILHFQQDLTTAVFIRSHFTFIQQVQIQC